MEDRGLSSSPCIFMVSLSPQVSIIIPTYMRAEIIGRAIKSVIGQTYHNWELIIIDNFSKDNTEEVVLNFNDKRIRFFKVHNHGIIAISRNKGIRLACGKWISFLDSDDWWDPDKLQICSEHMNQKVDVIYHDLKVVRDKSIWNNRVIRGKKLNKPIISDLLLNGNVIPNSSVMVRKSHFLNVGLINESFDMVGSEDYDTWLKLSTITDGFMYINKELGYYYDHDAAVSKKNMSHSGRAVIKQYLQALSVQDRSKIMSVFSYQDGRYLYKHKDFSGAIVQLKYSVRYGSFFNKFKSICMILISVVIIMVKPN